MFFRQQQSNGKYSSLSGHDIFGNPRVVFNWGKSIIKINNGSGFKQFSQDMFLIGKIQTNGFGRITKLYKIPPNLNHDMIILPDNRGIISMSGKYQVFLYKNNSLSRLFDLRDLKGSNGEKLDYLRYCSLKENIDIKYCKSKDYFHLNSFWYDEKDDSLLLSLRSQLAIIKVDLKSFNIKWIFGPALEHLNGLNQYKISASFNAKDKFNYGQHQVSILSNGNLFMFNNRDNIQELFPFWQFTPYASGDEYSIDEHNKTVQHIRHYGFDRGIKVSCCGGAQELPGDKRLVVFPNNAWSGENSSLYLIFDSLGHCIAEGYLPEKSYRIMSFDIYKGRH